jgi:radical SAM superfamily enzyme YgiQ (UPF0313 family)
MRVLIVTGSLLSAKERSPAAALKKQARALEASSGAWLDVQQKLAAAEHLACKGLFRKTRAYRSADYRKTVDAFFADERNFEAPELTEVTLMTLLDKEGLAYDAITVGDVFTDRLAPLLDRCDVVFVSTTLLRDLSEVVPVVNELRRPNKRIVLGGALTSILQRQNKTTWASELSVSVLAIGYGELLMPHLARWIRGEALTAPERGKLSQVGETFVLESGVPDTFNLDFIATPNWQLAERYWNKRFSLVHYESVRGCPYRCAFCNYPFLFADTKFRYKSAEKIADDWAQYAASGVTHVSCLDSLFTMPKKRLVRLCELLIERGVKIEWLCYARSDDLLDPEVCALMKRAGCFQVQIGAESGNDEQLLRMQKRSDVEKNVTAIKNCRAAGITTLCTVIVGFPGETAATVDDTIAFLRAAQPDFYYAAPFNTRVEDVPILSPESRRRYALESVSDGRSSAPYWRHATMACTEIYDHVERIHAAAMGEGLSLEGTLFYKGIQGYDASARPALLRFQRDVRASGSFVRAIFAWAHRWVKARLKSDVARVLGAKTAPPALPAVLEAA